MYKELDSLHEKILNSKFAEEVTEQEILALVEAKEIRAKAIDYFSERLKVVNKIIDIIKNEQQPTSCEHTKLKSFEMIEKIITDYQLRDSK